MTPLFVSQKKLEAWIEAGEVTFQDGVLTILAQATSYRVEAAVQVKSLLDGRDTAGLLGKVLSLRELTSAKLEHYQNSLISGETAYECEEGFICVQDPPPRPAAAPAAKPAVDGKKPAVESDLADFLLKHL